MPTKDRRTQAREIIWGLPQHRQDKLFALENCLQMKVDPSEVHEGNNESYNRKREEFLKEVKAGDEIWTFRTPEITWRALSGLAGYGILREEKIVKFLTVEVN